MNGVEKVAYCVFLSLKVGDEASSRREEEVGGRVCPNVVAASAMFEIRVRGRLQPGLPAAAGCDAFRREADRVAVGSGKELL